MSGGNDVQRPFPSIPKAWDPGAVSGHRFVLSHVRQKPWSAFGTQTTPGTGRWLMVECTMKKDGKDVRFSYQTA